jgi:PAS domain S-box-containing protein
MTVLPRRSKTNGYVAAISATALVALARLGLTDWLMDTMPFLPFIGAVAVAAWIGGLGPGVAATVLGSLMGTTFFLHPNGQTPTTLVADVVHASTFVGVGIVVSLLCEALHRSQNREADGLRRLADTLDGMGDAFFQLDADWKLVAVNRQYETGWGRTSADSVGKGFWDEWPGDAGTDLDAQFRRVAAEGTPADFEYHDAVRGRWSRVRVQPSPGGGLAVFAQDVTERVRQQAELKASHERFAQLADSVPQIVTVRRANGDLEFVNRRWGEYTGRPDAEADDVVGVVHPDDIAGLNARWGIAKLARVTLEVESRFRRFDGEYRWFLTRAVPALDATDPAATRWFGTSTDVHDQREAADRLREADRRKDEFLATLAHELRNPLAPIRNGLVVLKLGVSEPAAVERTRAMMERQLEHLVVLVDDLLDASRITQGKLTLRRVPADLARAVADAVEAVRPLTAQHAHRLVVECPPTTLCVDGDPTRLAQIVGNLLTNSAKYTPPGGNIRLTLERHADAAVLAVTDDGIGIPPAALGTIFGLFSQVDRTLEKTTGGLGIGLALVKGLVEMHGGTIAAESAGEGRGSTFTVRLPALPADAGDASPADEPSLPAAVGPRRWRVLVVDDNEDGADSLAALLELSGHEVRTAYDGLQAVTAAGEFRPDLILMDVGMPRLNGLDATRRIREHDWGRAAHIVALTGWGQEQDRRKSADAGAHGHLVKPVAPETVFKLLAGLTDVR